MATVYLQVRLKPSLAPAGESSTLREKLAAAGACTEVLVLIALVMGGLIAGWFTPTEAGGIAAAGAILFIVVLYFILGCFIDTMAMVLLTVPIFFPLIKTLGFDPLWFGILIALLVEMAMISPPIGMNVYVIAGVAKDVPMETIFLGILPFMITMLIFIVLIIAFPQIVLFLPGMMK